MWDFSHHFKMHVRNSSKNNSTVKSCYVINVGVRKYDRMWDYLSPGPMSKIRSDFRVRARALITKIRVRGIARVRGDSSNTSGSDS